jgi:DNA segregation ATPase FtsK/SpoIIIE-like protein
MGYGRAARVMDQLEKAGVLGPPPTAASPATKSENDSQS